MRNKAKGFPYPHDNKFAAGGTRAKAEYNSLRANGTINTHPQERMKASSNRDSDV